MPLLALLHLCDSLFPVGGLHRHDDAAVSAYAVVSIVTRKPLRIGIGGPVGSGKTALVDALCKTMRERYRLGVIATRGSIWPSAAARAGRF